MNNIFELEKIFSNNFKAVHPDSPLLVAVKYEKDEAVIKSLLVEEKKCCDHSGPVMELALCIALQKNAKNIVKILLDAECPLTGCGKHVSAMHCYLENPHSGLREDILDLLLKRGGNRMISSTDHHRSPICFALSHGADVNDIKLLLKKGANLHDCSSHESPMLCLTYRAMGRPVRERVVKLLHDLGAQVNIVDGYTKRTPLENVLTKCKFEMGALKMLFDLQSNHPEMTTKGLMHCAVGTHGNCKLDTVKFLVSQGIAVDSTDTNGKTPLHYAALNNRSVEMPKIIKFLVEKGCPINKKTKWGCTALRKAVTEGNSYEILMALLCAGASVGSSILWEVLQSFYKQGYGRRIPRYRFDWFQLCLKFSYLRNKNFSLKKLIKKDKGFKEFCSFGAKCLSEVKCMETKYVSHGRTLREFVQCGFFLLQKDTEVNRSELNQILGIMGRVSFPMYHEVIAARVGREAMVEKLREVSVYSVRYSPGTCIEEKVTLKYVCVCEIIKDLNINDLLSFIAAFYVLDNHASGNIKIINKRTVEKPAKRLKMDYRLS